MLACELRCQRSEILAKLTRTWPVPPVLSGCANPQLLPNFLSLPLPNLVQAVKLESIRDPFGTDLDGARLGLTPAVYHRGQPYGLQRTGASVGSL